jgi:myo-inositol-1(or 4)-monophosphatase
MKTIMFQCAEAASAILLRHFGKIESVVKKGEVDLVTVADKEAEKAIIRRIQIAFPGHAIQGEESGSISPEQEKTKSPGRRASRQFAPRPPAPRPSGPRPSVSCESAPRPSVSRPPEYCWLIDPLDGTMNFAHGNPLFTVSIALLRCGRPIMGLVADPMRGEWYFAERGKGAWLYMRRGDAGVAGSGARRGGGGGGFGRKRIHVSKVRKLGESLIYTGFPHNRREIAAQLAQTLQALLMCTHGVSRQGSAALDLCFVASGRCEAFYEPKLEPWDLAAGTLIVEEAGGRCTDYAGRRMITPGTRIVASNGRIHGALLRVIRENWTE